MQYPPYFRYRHKEGFTIIELMIVLTLIVAISSFTIFNFGTAARGETARNQVMQALVSQLRRAQSMALAGTTRSGGIIVCGYGIHQNDSRSYTIYAKEPPNTTVTCDQFIKSSTANYAAGDPTIEIVSLSNPSAEIVGTFSDIFFKIPNVTVYLNGQAGADASTSIISIEIGRAHV